MKTKITLNRFRFKSDDTINSKGFSAAYVIIDDADNGYGDDYSNYKNIMQGITRLIIWFLLLNVIRL